jgi:hypothetical protein
MSAYGRRFRWGTAILAFYAAFCLKSAALAEPRIEVTGGAPAFRDAALKFAPLQTAPVTIRSFSPSSAQLSSAVGDTLRFSVTATPPPGATLTYRWRVDGKVDAAAVTSQFIFVVRAAASISASVSDGQTTAEQTWTISVATAGVPTPKAGDGSGALDLDGASGDQSSRTVGGVKPKQKVDVQVLLNQEFANASGFQVVLKYDPKKVSVTGWKKDGTAFASAIDLPAQARGDSVTYGASILGGTTTASKGAVAVLTFETLSDFTGDTEIVLSSLAIRVAGVFRTLTPGASVVLSSAAAGLASDFDGNGEVGFDDFFAFAAAFGTRQGQAGYEAKFDLSKNGEVDFDDFFIFAGDFGKKK